MEDLSIYILQLVGKNSSVCCLKLFEQEVWGISQVKRLRAAGKPPGG
jgi:hypothetical protein